jgi:hypothetical protein
MKKIILALVVITLAACSSEPFKANKDNPLLVGDWTITEVDDAATLISSEEFMLSLLHEKYKEGNVFTFENGPNFVLNSSDGVKLLVGQYAIEAEDKSVDLQISPDNHEYSYDLTKNGISFTMTVTTPGELVNLVITKK